jgi:hypothetical protein
MACLALLPLTQERWVIGDVELYRSWAQRFWESGALPGRDYAWEYPPGAFPVLISPITTSRPANGMMFATEMLLLDGLLMLFAVRLAARTGKWHGAVLWLALPALMGPFVYARFDLASVALCAIGAALVARRPAIGGALIGIATLVKLWPALIAAALLCAKRSPRLAAGFVGALGAGVAASFALGFGGSLGTALSTQDRRGVQVEAVAALPSLWARALGSHVSLVFRQRATDVDARAAEHLAAVLFVLTALGLAALLLHAVRQQGLSIGQSLDLASAALVIALLGDKVLSPQYILWLGGLVTVSLCYGGQLRRSLVGLCCGIALLTHLVFPLMYEGLLDGDVLPVLLLTLRDSLLVLTLAVLLRRYLSSTRQGRRTAHPLAN